MHTKFYKETNLHIKLMCVNSYSTNYYIRIRTDLRSADIAKKLQSLKKRASPLSPGTWECERLVPKN